MNIVVVERIDGSFDTLIYPYSKAILEKEATINYRLISLGEIDAETFIDAFLEPGYFTGDNIVLEAGGIIVKDGIKYK